MPLRPRPIRLALAGAALVVLALVAFGALATRPASASGAGACGAVPADQGRWAQVSPRPSQADTQAIPQTPKLPAPGRDEPDRLLLLDELLERPAERQPAARSALRPARQRDAPDHRQGLRRPRRAVDRVAPVLDAGLHGSGRPAAGARQARRPGGLEHAGRILERAAAGERAARRRARPAHDDLAAGDRHAVGVLEVPAPLRRLARALGRRDAQRLEQPGRLRLELLARRQAVVGAPRRRACRSLAG